MNAIAWVNSDGRRGARLGLDALEGMSTCKDMSRQRNRSHPGARNRTEMRAHTAEPMNWLRQSTCMQHGVTLCSTAHSPADHGEESDKSRQQLEASAPNVAGATCLQQEPYHL